MSKNRKIMFRWFTIADFEKEEIFLREQHQKGFKFVKFIYPGFYLFEQCEPEDVIYQLDFSDVVGSDKNSYLQIFQDCEWEYMFDVNGWSYFRKPASEDGHNNAIFSDIETKIALLERVFKRRLMPLVIIFFALILPQLAINYNMWIHQDGMQSIHFILFVIFVVMFVLYLNLFLSFGLGLFKLKKKYIKV